MKGRPGIFRPSGLYFRIMLPAVSFVLIFSFLFIGVSHYHTSLLLDRRLEREAVRISRLLSESRFILSHVYLKRLGEVIEGRIAVFNKENQIVASSFDPRETGGFLSLVHPGRIRGSLAGPKTVVNKLVAGKNTYLLVSKSLSFPDLDPHMVLTILTSMDDLESMNRTTVSVTLMAGVLSFFVALGGSLWSIRSVRRDVREIMTVTRDIAAGDFNSKVRLPKNIREMEILAESVNKMSSRLRDYERQLVDSTRLASAAGITRAMAHEIKNPLSSMKMLAQILEHGGQPPEDQARTAAVLIQEINRVDRLVSDMGTLAGQGKYQFSLVRPGLPLEEVMELIRPKMDHLKIKAETLTAGELPGVMMDRDKIKQVLWNLLKNGIESMPEGGRLGVFLETDPEGGTVNYRIRDYGGGLGREDREQVFAPFHTTKKEGIGIGLHVSREIARAHGGDLQLIPEPKGTTAVLTLPAVKENDGPHPRSG